MDRHLKRRLLTTGMASAATAAEYRAGQRLLEQFPDLSGPAKDKKITQIEVNIVTAIFMTGPRASRPTWRAVRKAVSRNRRKLPLEGSWRSWPTEGVIHV